MVVAPVVLIFFKSPLQAKPLEARGETASVIKMENSLKTGILRDRTTKNKQIYIPNYDEQNVIFFTSEFLNTVSLYNPINSTISIFYCEGNAMPWPLNKYKLIYSQKSKNL